MFCGGDFCGMQSLLSGFNRSRPCGRDCGKEYMKTTCIGKTPIAISRRSSPSCEMIAISATSFPFSFPPEVRDDVHARKKEYTNDKNDMDPTSILPHQESSMVLGTPPAVLLPAWTPHCKHTCMTATWTRNIPATTSR
jgi:hypothetical protein